jgi:hypothetical protein
MDSRGVTHRFLLTLANEISEALPQPESSLGALARGSAGSSAAPFLHAFLVDVLTAFCPAKRDVAYPGIKVVVADWAFPVDRLAGFL